MLACSSIVGAQKEHLKTSLEIVQRNYSSDLKNLILYVFLYEIYRVVHEE